MLHILPRDKEGKKNIVDPRVEGGLSKVEIIPAPSTIVIYAARGRCVVPILSCVRSCNELGSSERRRMGSIPNILYQQGPTRC